MAEAPASHSRPLDGAAMVLIFLLCTAWGFNQVAIKLALPEIPPLIQCTVRTALALLIVLAIMRWRGLPIASRDGTLAAGIVAGVLFGIEFVLIYRGLVFTTASRAVLFIYLAPFFVTIGARLFMPSDRFGPLQWAGLLMSFAGMLIAFGVPAPSADPNQIVGDIMMVAAAAAWAATTLVIKASSLARISAEKTLVYQLVVCIPITGIAAVLFDEQMSAAPSALAIGSVAYQTAVVSLTYAAWFALIVKFSASRLSAFTFLTPLCGVAAGHLVMGDPLTPAFALAVVLVAAGLVLVNRPR
jgi:drug/metabolite transporter (DMT)-like permease